MEAVIEIHPMYLMLLLSSIIVYTLGFTSPSSLVRPAVLPILFLLAFIITLTGKNFMRTAWSSILGAFAFAFTLQFIVMGLMERWSFEAGGPTSPIDSGSANKKHPKDKIRPVPEQKSNKFWDRLKFGFNSFSSFRDINTPHEAKGIVPFSKTDPDYVPSKPKFLTQAIIRYCVCYLILDAIQSQPPPPDNASVFAASRVPVFSRLSEITLEEIALRIVSSAVVWLTIYALLQTQNSLFAIVGVGLGFSSPKDWKPLFGSIGDSYTLRGFWGVFWHQVTRKIFSKPSIYFVDRILHLPRGIISRYSKIFLTFAMSGLFHLWADFGAGIPLGVSGAMKLFVLQGVGIVIEDSTQVLWRFVSGGRRRTLAGPVPLWKKIVGFVWVVGFLLFWSSPFYFWPLAARSKGGVDIQICPVSVVGMLTRKEKGV